MSEVKRGGASKLHGGNVINFGVVFRDRRADICFLFSSFSVIEQKKHAIMQEDIGICNNNIYIIYGSILNTSLKILNVPNAC